LRLFQSAFRLHPVDERSGRLWSTEDWSEVKGVELGARGAFQLAIAPQGDAVTVCADNLIQTIAVKGGQIVGRIELPVKGVYGLAISPDDRYLAISTVGLLVNGLSSGSGRNLQHHCLDDLKMICRQRDRQL
jgi:hypothetical protein